MTDQKPNEAPDTQLPQPASKSHAEIRRDALGMAIQHSDQPAGVIRRAAMYERYLAGEAVRHHPIDEFQTVVVVRADCVPPGAKVLAEGSCTVYTTEGER